METAAETGTSLVQEASEHGWTTGEDLELSHREVHEVHTPLYTV